MPQPFDHVVHDVASTARLSEAHRHRLLESERRRFALQVCARRREPILLGELAREVARLEAGIDHTDADAVDRIACALHHCHLPVMAETGVVAYRAEDHRVVPLDVPL